jgi:hypothetical protein
MKRRKAFILFAVIMGFAVPLALSARGATITPAGDLKIPKAEITSTAKFYPYKAGNIGMEVLALRALDGTIRTAFNTCQVCYSSGRGYYVQQGDVLVCQNCGNRFRASQVEIIKGGCNPVPISRELKTEDAENITISKAVLQEAAFLFTNWKRR